MMELKVKNAGLNKLFRWFEQKPFLRTITRASASALILSSVMSLQVLATPYTFNDPTESIQPTSTKQSNNRIARPVEAKSSAAYSSAIPSALRPPDDSYGSANQNNAGNSSTVYSGGSQSYIPYYSAAPYQSNNQHSNRFMTEEGQNGAQMFQNGPQGSVDDTQFNNRRRNRQRNHQNFSNQNVGFNGVTNYTYNGTTSSAFNGAPRGSGSSGFNDSKSGQTYGQSSGPDNRQVNGPDNRQVNGYSFANNNNNNNVADNSANGRNRVRPPRQPNEFNTGAIYQKNLQELTADQLLRKPDKYADNPQADSDGVRHFANGQHFDLSTASLTDAIDTINASPIGAPRKNRQNIDAQRFGNNPVGWLNPNSLR